MAEPEREVFGADEIRRAIAACADTPTGHRDALTITLLWATGLKVADLLAMRPPDLTRTRARRRDGSWGPIAREHQDSVRARREAWSVDRTRIIATERPGWADKGVAANNVVVRLLCNLRGAPLDASYLRHMLATVSDISAIPRRLHAAGLRNTFAADLYKSGASLEDCRVALGLATVQYTAGYIASICPVR